jgi:predicted Zn-dependent protease
MHLKYPQGTLWNLYWGPRIESAIAILNHKPLEAIALLEPTRPLDNRGLDSRLVRGNAYLAAREPASAEKEFQDAVAHHELDPDLGDYALSWLGLGRALAVEDKRTAAIEAYQHFLTLWAHADPDAKFLQQARQEFAALQKSVPVK